MTWAAPVALTGCCLACVAALLLAERAGSRWGRVLLKLGASSSFVAVAVSLGAPGSVYGRWMLAALLLGWLGDALLLSRQPPAFLAGLGAFLLSHLCFALAFLGGALSTLAIGIASVAALAFGAGVQRWLEPHLTAGFRWPVRAYVAVILLMCVAAAGHAAAAGRWAVLAGALLFALSDLAVARDRFVHAGFANKLWGWPTYFGAQLLLAWTVAGAA
jgi:uncharacterized membrane protein YhhN